MCRRFQNRRSAAARESMEEENPAAPRTRVNLTADNQSLVNSIRSSTLTLQEKETCCQSLFNLMTSSEVEGEAQFLEVISTLEEKDLPNMASLLTSHSDRFLEIARDKNGSNRLRTLIGKSDDVDIFFFAPILGRFVDVLTDKDASHVAIHGMRYFNEWKRKAMCPLVVFHAVHLACHGRGYLALNEIIANLGDPDLGDLFFREELVDKVVSNALSLSSDVFGNFVVQHVLELDGLRTTREVADNLSGHFVELSLRKSGSYIVERLLERVVSRPMVVAELLGCEEDKFMMLASSEYGYFVVRKALRVTQHEIEIRPDRFWDLVNKLRPLHQRLLKSNSYGRALANFLNSINSLKCWRRVGTESHAG